MSQMDYYGHPSLVKLPHQSGLEAWGVVLIVFGSLAGVFAVIALIFAVVMAARLIPGAPQQNAGVLFVGVGVYVLAAFALISLGIGSRRGRRWVRPVIIVGSILVTGSGLISMTTLTLGLVANLVHPATKPAGPALPFNPAIVGYVFGACLGFLTLIAFPLSLLWFYGRSSVQTTLDSMDPHPRWTDRVPMPVLGWIIGCIVLGFGFTSMAIQGVIPCFAVVLVGPPADALALVLALMLIVGGILCYRQSPLGWVTTVAAVALLAASFTTFFFAGDHKLYADLLLSNLPEQQRALAEQVAGDSNLIPMVTYMAALIYAVVIRRKFRDVVPAPVFSEPHSNLETLTDLEEL